MPQQNTCNLIVGITRKRIRRFFLLQKVSKTTQDNVKTIQGKARQDWARQGTTRRDKKRQDAKRQDTTRRGETRRHKTKQDQQTQDSARQTKKRHGLHSLALLAVLVFFLQGGGLCNNVKEIYISVCRCSLCQPTGYPRSAK